MTIERPIIRVFNTRETFSYLWLKYVTDFDLTNHCAKCLIGEYSKAFEKGGNTQTVFDLPLNEYDAKYYYLCGVTKPYRWSRNLHVAFEYAKGETLHYDDGKTLLFIENARQITIEEQSHYISPFGHLRSYNTCRNWRFAYQMTHAEINENTTHLRSNVAKEQKG